MKTELKISLVLTWFNGIVWGIIVALCLLASLSSGNMYVLVSAFLMAATVLHSYASLKLHRSIRYPKIPLSDQTPVGIRFVGFVVLFLGILCIGDGIALMNPPDDVRKMMISQMPAEYKNINYTPYLRGMGVLFIILGLCLCVNVTLNFRLLRWYYLVKQSDVS